jgi:signal transduction histidine kinase
MVTATAEAQRSFLSRVSHEMRSPLNVIHGYSQLLARLQLPESATGHVAHIERGVDRMVQIVDDLLLLGQLDQGLVRLEEQHVSVAELASEVLTAAQAQPWWRDGTLVGGDEPSTTGITVRTDRSRFSMTALLLAEATVEAQSGPLELRPFGGGSRAGVQFVVDATSPVVSSLWTPFVQSHTIPGAGLGLAVARSLAAALDLLVEARWDADEPETARLVLSLPTPQR